MVNPPWWPESVNSGIVTYPPGGSLGPRTQLDYQLVAVHSGWVRLTLDATSYHYAAGDVFLLQPGHREFFQFATDQPTRHSWVAARVRSVPLLTLPGFGGDPPRLELTAELDNLLLTARRAQSEPGPFGEHLAMLAAQAALVYFWRQAGLEPEAHDLPVHPAVLAAKAYLREHLAQPLSLRVLAKAAAVSAEHLCRLFAEAGEPPPMATAWRERTEVGLRLLVASGLAVGEIADRCGFKTVFHFSRRVKEATGLSPTAYRKKHWNP
ncbi:MAG TPA: AraC family transcriptional regulator [Limnochordia bacterium]|nr:AraC family transcriptional regulator [Limnochordia bacterium]